MTVMICTQWIWIVELDDRVIGYYANEETAISQARFHAEKHDNNCWEYDIFQVPVMQC